MCRTFLQKFGWRITSVEMSLRFEAKSKEPQSWPPRLWDEIQVLGSGSSKNDHSANGRGLCTQLFGLFVLESLNPAWKVSLTQVRRTRRFL